TASDCPAAVAGGRSSTPTQRATAAPASATGAGWRRSRSRGTASRSRPSWRRHRWGRSGSCTRTERFLRVAARRRAVPAPARTQLSRCRPGPGIMCRSARSSPVRTGPGPRRNTALMRHGLRRGLTAAAVGCVLLTGCSSTVVGSAAPGGDVPTDVSANDFPITAAGDDQEDTSARNALVDLNTFWSQAYPDAFGEPFQPLEGYFSVDSTNI